MKEYPPSSSSAASSWSKQDLEKYGSTALLEPPPQKKAGNTCFGACYCGRKTKLGMLVALMTALGVPLILLVAALINAAVVESPYERMDLDGVPDGFMELDEQMQGRDEREKREPMSGRERNFVF